MLVRYFLGFHINYGSIMNFFRRAQWNTLMAGEIDIFDMCMVTELSKETVHAAFSSPPENSISPRDSAERFEIAQKLKSAREWFDVDKILEEYLRAVKLRGAIENLRTKNLIIRKMASFFPLRSSVTT